MLIVLQTFTNISCLAKTAVSGIDGQSMAEILLARSAVGIWVVGLVADPQLPVYLQPCPNLGDDLQFLRKITLGKAGAFTHE